MVSHQVPVRKKDDAFRSGFGLFANQVAIGNDVLHGNQDIGPVIEEIGQAEALRDERLLWTFFATVQIGAFRVDDAGELEKIEAIVPFERLAQPLKTAQPGTETAFGYDVCILLPCLVNNMTYAFESSFERRCFHVPIGEKHVFFISVAADDDFGCVGLSTDNHTTDIDATFAFHSCTPWVEGASQSIIV